MDLDRAGPSSAVNNYPSYCLTLNIIIMNQPLKELKEFLVFAFTLQAVLTDFIKSGKKGGSIGKWLQAFKFMPLVPTVQPAFEGLGNPLDHYKALTKEEKEELHQYFIDEFDLPNDQVEHLIEDAIGVAAVNVEFTKKVIAVVKKK